MKIDFLPDRYPKAVLKETRPAVFRCLESRGILDGKNDLVRFAGIASVKPDECTVFLPHGLATGSEENRTGFAKLAMAAISKYARDFSRPGEAEGEEESLSYVAAMVAIAEDFRDNGIYSERLRITSVNTGKPDWRSTFRRELPMLATSGAPVFGNIRTARPFSSNNNVLAIIQAAVVKELYDRHGWWLERYFGTRPVPRDVPVPEWPRELWAAMLGKFRQNLFAERPLMLARFLEAYLDGNPEAGDGAVVCGIADFSAVWEKMLQQVLPGTEYGWNSRLPGPRYTFHDGSAADSGRMAMDIVVRDDFGLVVADAKYYLAKSVDTAPGWADIVKQMYYTEALETVVDEGTQIRTCFIFPRAPNSNSVLKTVGMHKSGGDPEPRFPQVKCYYADTAIVADAYCSGRKIAPLF